MSQDLVMGIAVGTYETKGVLERGVEIGGHQEACAFENWGALGRSIPRPDIVACASQICSHSAAHGSHTQISDSGHNILLEALSAAEARH